MAAFLNDWWPTLLELAIGCALGLAIKWRPRKVAPHPDTMAPAPRPFTPEFEAAAAKHVEWLEGSTMISPMGTIAR